MEQGKHAPYSLSAPKNVGLHPVEHPTLAYDAVFTKGPIAFDTQTLHYSGIGLREKSDLMKY